jgi:replicative superfamily II helicase
LIEQLKIKRNQIIIYLVPTRSLIQQVELDLFNILNMEKIFDVYISTLPIIPDDTDENSMVFVLTQERFQWLLTSSQDLEPDLVIIDEAQKVGDGSRGILLQQVVEEIDRRSDKTKVIFSSPMTSNPEILLEQARKEIKTKTVTTEHITVNQNLLWVSQVYMKPREWDVDLCLGEKNVALGKINLPRKPSKEANRLPYIAFSLRDKTGGNLIYTNKPSDAEKIGKVLWDLQGKEANTQDNELLELIALVKKVINSDYDLALTLERGIGFHYGNMPLIIKNEIERLFSIGKIKFLVCTSTLIEGMNLLQKTFSCEDLKRV